MRGRFVWAAGLAIVMFACAGLRAEVPPLPKAELEEKAELVVTGTVTKVEVTEVKGRDGSVRERRHRLSVKVAKVEKGKPKDPDKPLVARGVTYVLKPMETGSGGHYAGKLAVRVSAVKEGWELKLYLKPGKDGEYDILFPNGFEVVKRPDAKEQGDKGTGN